MFYDSIIIVPAIKIKEFGNFVAVVLIVKKVVACRQKGALSCLIRMISRSAVSYLTPPLTFFAQRSTATLSLPGPRRQTRFLSCLKDHDIYLRVLTHTLRHNAVIRREIGQSPHSKQSQSRPKPLSNGTKLLTPTAEGTFSSPTTRITRMLEY